MHFEYRDEADQILNKILGNKLEFEDLVSQVSKNKPVKKVSVRPLTQGLSGCAVFLVRRRGKSEYYTPWVVKICKDMKLIIAERDNNDLRVQGRIASAPQLINTSSSKILIFTFGGSLAESNPVTFRNGYGSSSARALGSLMSRTVRALRPLHMTSEDLTSCVDRMSRIADLSGTFASIKSSLAPEDLKKLERAWQGVWNRRYDFPYLYSGAHGDLNAGNILFEAGEEASQPLIIDFASMLRSKDNNNYPEAGQHLPFWDFAKLERDIQTRMFLKEATAEGLAIGEIVAAVRNINGDTSRKPSGNNVVLKKFLATTTGLRKEVRRFHSPADLRAYRVVLAYAMLTVFTREVPDDDVSLDIQHQVAFEASVALLSRPDSILPSLGSRSLSNSQGEGDAKRSPKRLSRVKGFGAELLRKIVLQRGLFQTVVARNLHAVEGKIAVLQDKPNGEGMTFVRNDEQVQICGRINADAFKNGPWCGTGSGFYENCVEKTERNRSHVQKNPKAIVLISATSFEGFLPSSTYVGFTHILPLNQRGFADYCEGKVEDNLLGPDVICSPDEVASGFLLFTVAIDPRSVKGAYQGMYRKLGRSGAVQVRHKYHLLELLVRAIALHLRELSISNAVGRQTIKLITQHGEHSGVREALMTAGFQETRHMTGDKGTVWEATLDLRELPSSVMGTFAV